MQLMYVKGGRVVADKRGSFKICIKLNKFLMLEFNAARFKQKFAVPFIFEVKYRRQNQIVRRIIHSFLNYFPLNYSV